jgi:hypothetical protein
MSEDDVNYDDVHLLLIVTGAHLRAEMADRPLAYALQQGVVRWLDTHRESLSIEIVPVVCCDIWFINQEQLHARPTICVGGPGVNALSAFMAQKLKVAYVRDERLMVQLDPEFVDLRACVWGMDHETTVEAVQIFTERYLDGYLRAVATQIEPR